MASSILPDHHYLPRPRNTSTRSLFKLPQPVAPPLPPSATFFKCAVRAWSRELRLTACGCASLPRTCTFTSNDTEQGSALCSLLPPSLAPGDGAGDPGCWRSREGTRGMAAGRQRGHSLRVRFELRSDALHRYRVLPLVRPAECLPVGRFQWGARQGLRCCVQ